MQEALQLTGVQCSVQLLGASWVASPLEGPNRYGGGGAGSGGDAGANGPWSDRKAHRVRKGAREGAVKDQA